MTNNCSISSFNVDNLDDLKQACAQLKKGQLSFFSLIMNNNTVLHLNHVQQKAAGSASAKDWWNEMTERLNDDQVCFVVCNVDYLCQTDQVNRGKTVLIHWAPDTAPVKQKMLSAAIARSIRPNLESLGINAFAVIPASAKDEVDYENVVQRILSRTTVK